MWVVSWKGVAGVGERIGAAKVLVGELSVGMGQE